jgi:hypothetical protein
MVEAKKKVSRKKTAKKKTTVRKKAAVKKKVTTRKKTSTTNRKTADTSRHALTARLKLDLKATRKAFREELKLVRVAAKDEIAVLKDQLSEALKREKGLVKLSEQKAMKMLAAGERWEKKQLAKIKKAAARARKKK